ncbi:MAG: thiolase family protein [Nocardioidaceae bacterium]
MANAVIVDTVRTATGRGKPGGALAGVHPATLMATTIRALVDRQGLDPNLIEDVMAGCCGQVKDQSANIARTAALAAGLPEHVPGVTVDRQCGSSQQTAAFAAQGIVTGMYDAVIACGVESMSNVPLFSATTGGDPFAPLATRYPDGLPPQGYGAEMIAARLGISRTELDEFSLRSHQLAAEAASSGKFANEIVPVLTQNGEHAHDETIRPATSMEGLAALPSAFYNEEMAAKYPHLRWNITAGNSSPLTDGAAAVLIMNEDKAKELGLRPRARFHTFSVTGSDPVEMLSGVIPATQKALARSGLSVDDIGTYECNEAFAPVPLALIKELGIAPERVNPRGGAIAIGHPLGGSGARLLATMVNHMEDNGIRYGLQTMCEGGGMANATIVELIS